jgi:hypothetical protein
MMLHHGNTRAPEFLFSHPVRTARSGALSGIDLV